MLMHQKDKGMKELPIKSLIKYATAHELDLCQYKTTKVPIVFKLNITEYGVEDIKSVSWCSF